MTARAVILILHVLILTCATCAQCGKELLATTWAVVSFPSPATWTTLYVTCPVNYQIKQKNIVIRNKSSMCRISQYQVMTHVAEKAFSWSRENHKNSHCFKGHNSGTNKVLQWDLLFSLGIIISSNRQAISPLTCLKFYISTPSHGRVHFIHPYMYVNLQKVFVFIEYYDFLQK